MDGKRGPKNMTDEHKAALERGRFEGRAVKAYLEAVRGNKPKRGRKRTPESIKKRLITIEESLADASVVEELQLVQERRDLDAELERMDAKVDISDLEDAFVEVAKSYGDRKGISYSSWRDVGVTPTMLKRADIGRGT